MQARNDQVFFHFHFPKQIFVSFSPSFTKNTVLRNHGNMHHFTRCAQKKNRKKKRMKDKNRKKNCKSWRAKWKKNASKLKWNVILIKIQYLFFFYPTTVQVINIFLQAKWQNNTVAASFDIIHLFSMYSDTYHQSVSLNKTLQLLTCINNLTIWFCRERERRKRDNIHIPHICRFCILKVIFPVVIFTVSG